MQLAEGGVQVTRGAASQVGERFLQETFGGAQFGVGNVLGFGFATRAMSGVAHVDGLVSASMHGAGAAAAEFVDGFLNFVHGLDAVAVVIVVGTGQRGMGIFQKLQGAGVLRMHAGSQTKCSGQSD